MATMAAMSWIDDELPEEKGRGSTVEPNLPRLPAPRQGGEQYDLPEAKLPGLATDNQGARLFEYEPARSDAMYYHDELGEKVEREKDKGSKSFVSDEPRLFAVKQAGPEYELPEEKSRGMYIEPNMPRMPDARQGGEQYDVPESKLPACFREAWRLRHAAAR